MTDKITNFPPATGSVSVFWQIKGTLLQNFEILSMFLPYWEIYKSFVLLHEAAPLLSKVSRKNLSSIL